MKLGYGESNPELPRYHRMMRGGNVSRYTISDTSAVGKYPIYAFCNRQTRERYILDFTSGEFLRPAEESKSVSAKEDTGANYVSQIDDRDEPGVLGYEKWLPWRLPLVILASCVVFILRGRLFL